MQHVSGGGLYCSSRRGSWAGVNNINWIVPRNTNHDGKVAGWICAQPDALAKLLLSFKPVIRDFLDTAVLLTWNNSSATRSQLPVVSCEAKITNEAWHFNAITFIYSLHLSIRCWPITSEDLPTDGFYSIKSFFVSTPVTICTLLTFRVH